MFCRIEPILAETFVSSFPMGVLNIFLFFTSVNFSKDRPHFYLKRLSLLDNRRFVRDFRISGRVENMQLGRLGKRSPSGPVLTSARIVTAE